MTVLHVIVILDPFTKWCVEQFLKLELLAVIFTNIIGLCTGLEMGYQVFKLQIRRVFLKGGDWDAVVKLLAEGVHGIVHEQDVL